MTRPEINAHPTVAPLLEAWRKARKERDRVDLDGRCGPRRRAHATHVARLAEINYELAVAGLDMAHELQEEKS